MRASMDAGGAGREQALDMTPVAIKPITGTAPDLLSARQLFREYVNSLPFVLDFQDFEQELVDLPGRYREPDGCILLGRDLARADHPAVACVALRPLAPRECEMKRMYVQPASRGQGIGRQLGAAIILEAQRRGYQRMRLDTVSRMAEANALYHSLGFEPCPAYCHNPLPDALYFVRDLGTVHDVARPG